MNIEHCNTGRHSSRQRLWPFSYYAAIFFLFVFYGITTHAQEKEKMPPGVVLLKTTRTDLDKMFTTEPGSSDSRIEFRIDGRRFEARFANERCTWDGWDVEPGTLISLSVEVETETKANVDKFRADGFEHHNDDADHQQYWSNAKGIRYDVDSLGLLTTVMFFPTTADSGLRCPGFPPFDISTQTYSTYFDEKLQSFEDPDFLNLLDFTTRVRDRNDLKGYLFIYHKTGGSAEAERYVDAVRKLIEKRDANASDRIEIRVGGIRDENEVEGYLLLATQTRPQPYPKFASSDKPLN